MRSYVRYNRALARQYGRWMVAMHYAEHTQLTYQRVIRRFLEFIGKRSIATASHFDIRRFVGQISDEGASLNTAYSVLGVLRLFYDFLNLGGVVSYVAPRFVKLRRPVHNSKPPLTEPQVQQLISATQTPRERAMVEVFYATGCRLKELRLLKIEDLDFNTKTVRIRGKFGKVRTAFLTNSAVDAVRAYIAARKRGIIFQQDFPVQRGCLYAQNGRWVSRITRYVGREGKPVPLTRTIGRIDLVSYEVAKARHEKNLNHRNRVRPVRKHPLSAMQIQVIIRSIARRADIKGVSPHSLRHTFATHLYDHGAPVEIVKALMGHVWISTTMKYTHVPQARVAKTFEQCHPRPKLNILQSVPAD